MLGPELGSVLGLELVSLMSPVLGLRTEPGRLTWLPPPLPAGGLPYQLTEGDVICVFSQ